MRREILICIVTTLFVLSCASLPSQGDISEGTVEVSEDEYWYREIDFNSGISMDVSYTMEVLSGPYIDVFFMDDWNFQEYEAGNSFDVVQELTEINTKFANLKSTLTTHGTYYLVFDNTDVKTDPPWNMFNDVATISYTLDYSTGINAQAIFVLMIGIAIAFIVVIIIIAIAVVIIHKRKKVPPIPPQQYIPPPAPPLAPPPQQPMAQPYQPMAYQPPPQQYSQHQPPQYPPRPPV